MLLRKSPNPSQSGNRPGPSPTPEPKEPQARRPLHCQWDSLALLRLYLFVGLEALGIQDRAGLVLWSPFDLLM